MYELNIKNDKKKMIIKKQIKNIIDKVQAKKYKNKNT